MGTHLVKQNNDFIGDGLPSARLMRHDGHGSIQDDAIRHRQLSQLTTLLMLRELLATS